MEKLSPTIKKEIGDFMVLISKCHEKILEIYNKDFYVDYKNDKSPLTEADLECNKIICKYLSAKYPNIPIISEENKNVGYDIRKNYTEAWIVDPIDGTKEFVKKNGQFTVNIGKVRLNKESNKFEPVLGVVSIPVSQEFYYGSLESESPVCVKLNLDNSDVKHLKINSSKNQRIDSLLMSSKLRIAMSGSHCNDLTKKFVDDLYGFSDRKNFKRFKH